MPVTTHHADAAGAERVMHLAASEFDATPGEDLHLVAHTEHPHDDTASLTTVLLSRVGAAYISVYVTWRDENGGNVELVASPFRQDGTRLNAAV